MDMFKVLKTQLSACFHLGAAFCMSICFQNCSTSKEEHSSSAPMDSTHQNLPKTSFSDSLWISINDSMGFYMPDNEETRLKMASWDAIKRLKQQDLEDYTYNSNTDTSSYPVGAYHHRSGQPPRYLYTYILQGVDRDGRVANGEVKVQGKFGKGWVSTHDGKTLSLNVYWGKDGLLYGTDAERMDYVFKP